MVGAAGPELKINMANVELNKRDGSGSPLPRYALSIRETAQVMGLSQKSVRRLCDRGILKPCRALRHLRISAEQVRKLIEG